MVELGLQPQQPGSREQVLNLSALSWVKPERTFSEIKVKILQTSNGWLRGEGEKEMK